MQNAKYCKEDIVMTMEAISYIKQLVSQGKNIAVISCEDPYNTLFHYDVLGINRKYVHLMPEIGSLIKPASIDLALQHKHINVFGVFGHYGIVHEVEVCAAIKSLSGDYSHFGPDLQKAVKKIADKFDYNFSKDLRSNILAWTWQQFNELKEMIEYKQRILKTAVHGPIEIFGGIVENIEDAKKYKAEILWRETIEQRLNYVKAI